MRNAIRTFAFFCLFFLYKARLKFALWTCLGFIPNIIASFSYGTKQGPYPGDDGD